MSAYCPSEEPSIMKREESLKLLDQARAIYSQSELATLLERDIRTIRRWETRESEPPAYLSDVIRQRVLNLTDQTHVFSSSFRFIDLFAGIGGIRHGFEASGGRCVFTSEWNTFAQKTYLANFPPSENHLLVGDITSVEAEDIPDHEVLLAGFPCQPFSIAGVSKKNSLGRPHGFECDTQGTLFFDVARIIEAKKPKAFMLENVKNLVSHDKGNTFKIILKTLRDELGYDVHYRVIDGGHFVPQHRERIIIVGFSKPTNFSWDDLHLPEMGPRLSTILHPQNGSELAEPPYTEGKRGKVNEKYTLTLGLWEYLQAYAAKHRAAGNGFGFGLVDGSSVTRTLSARYYKDGSEILLSQGIGKRPRRLTPRECARLMGYPDTFKIPVSDTQAYKQFGNSVIVPVMTEVARIMVPQIKWLMQQDKQLESPREKRVA